MIALIYPESERFQGSFPANHVHKGDLLEQHRLFLQNGGISSFTASIAQITPYSGCGRVKILKCLIYATQCPILTESIDGRMTWPCADFISTAGQSST
jgi:hypothetical protein